MLQSNRNQLMSGSRHQAIFCDEDGIVHVVVCEIQSVGDAENFIKESKRIKSKENPKTLGLIDLRDAKLNQFSSYRKYFAEAAKIGETTKAAILHDETNRLFWVFTQFVFSAAGMLGIQQNTKFFSSEEKAIVWLKQK